MVFLLFTFLILIIICIIVELFPCGKVNVDNTEKHELMSKYNTCVAKGIAIIFVVLSHLGSLFGLRILTPLGGIGVAIFLIITGYGLMESFLRHGLKKFWKKKFEKIFVPYFIVEIIYLIIQKKELTLVDIFLDFSLIKPLYPYSWFLNFIILNYTLFFIIFSISIIRMNSKIILFTFASFCMFIFSEEIRAEQAFSVLIGMLISINRNRIIKYCERKYLPVLLLLGLSILGLKQINSIRQLPPMTFNLIQLLIKVPLAIFTLFSGTGLVSKFLYYAGKISFEIYLIHSFFIHFVAENVTFLYISLFWGGTFSLSFLASKVLEIKCDLKTKEA